MAVTAKGLREKRAGLFADARKILDAHDGAPPNDEQAKVDQMFADADKLEVQIKNIERIESADAEIGNVIDRVTRTPSGRRAGSDGAMIPMRAGRYGVTQEVQAGERGSVAYRDSFNRFLAGSSLSPQEYAALRSDDDAQAGYLVASEQMAAGLLKDVDDLLYIRQWATVHAVKEAKALGIRKRTAKASTFAYGTELQLASQDTSLAYGKRVLTPKDLTGEIRVSRDLLRYSTAGAEAIVREEMALNAAEVQETKFLLGSGAGEPLGLFVASTDGISSGRDVSTGNSSTAIAADNLFEVYYKLKMQYRANARWLFHRDAIKAIRKLKDTTNQYLWQTSLQAGQPDLLLGKPAFESERAPNTFTTGLYVGIFGDFSHYHIADALDIEMQRLEEKYAEFNQIGFIGRLKNDGGPMMEEAFARVTLA